MDEERKVPAHRERFFPVFVRTAYPRLIAKLGPSDLKQWLLQALPVQTETTENKRNPVGGDFFSLLS